MGTDLKLCVCRGRMDSEFSPVFSMEALDRIRLVMPQRSSAATARSDKCHVLFPSGETSESST